MKFLTQSFGGFICFLLIYFIGIIVAYIIDTKFFRESGDEDDPTTFFACYLITCFSWFGITVLLIIWMGEKMKNFIDKYILKIK